VPRVPRGDRDREPRRRHVSDRDVHGDLGQVLGAEAHAHDPGLLPAGGHRVEGRDDVGEPAVAVVAQDLVAAYLLACIFCM
jgi:hypothetical protein